MQRTGISFSRSSASARLCCCTCEMWRTSTVPSSPTVNPTSLDSLSSVVVFVTFSRIVMGGAFGSAAQNTIEPPAPTGATWNESDVAPPFAARTSTEMRVLTVCPASAAQMPLGIVQLSLIVYATSGCDWLSAVIVMRTSAAVVHLKRGRSQLFG
jgi:hypothetical protein